METEDVIFRSICVYLEWQEEAFRPFPLDMNCLLPLRILMWLCLTGRAENENDSDDEEEEEEIDNDAGEFVCLAEMLTFMTQLY